MKSDVTVVLVGIGGYASVYVDALLGASAMPGLRLVGAVDPFAKGSRHYEDIVAAGVPIFDRLEDFYAERTADLAVIVTPIHFHKPQTILAMEHGSHVLCEKPVTVLNADVAELLAMQQKSGLEVSVGYQWSHSEAIQRLKADVLAGVYGAAKRMKTIVFWPRNDQYYQRGSGWAGKKQTASGDWILDSVASNATAHYLHNMLYVAGDRVDRAAKVAAIEVETYRANPIEMFDTCAMRVQTESGVEMLYLVTHAVSYAEWRNPEFVFEFEGGLAYAREVEGQIEITGQLSSGEIIEYGQPNADDTRKLRRMRDVIWGDADVVCGIEAASEHTRVMNAVERIQPDSVVFPAERVARDELQQQNYVPGLADVMARAYDEWRLPCELAVEGFEFLMSVGTEL